MKAKQQAHAKEMSRKNKQSRQAEKRSVEDYYMQHPEEVDTIGVESLLE